MKTEAKNEQNSNLKLDALTHSQRSGFARKMFGHVRLTDFALRNIVEVR